MAHLTDLHMKRVQQRRKSAAKTVKWGMEKAAESQKVHTTWSQHACFDSCEESSAALVFNCVPRKKCQSQVLQTLKCEQNYSAFVFGMKIHTQTEAKMRPQRQVGYFGDTQCKHNSTNQTHTAGQVCAHPKARPDYGCVPGLENGSDLRRVSDLFAFFGMVEWNKAQHHRAPQLWATAASSSAPPCWCLPSSRSWNCIVMDARVCGEGKGREGEGREEAGGKCPAIELIVMETSVCLEVRHTVNVGGVLIALPQVCACERCFAFRASKARDSINPMRDSKQTVASVPDFSKTFRARASQKAAPQLHSSQRCSVASSV